MVRLALAQGFSDADGDSATKYEIKTDAQGHKFYTSSIGSLGSW